MSNNKKVDQSFIKSFYRIIRKHTFSGKYEDLENKPDSIKNPHKLKFTGAVSAVYDGSEEKEIAIPLPADDSGKVIIPESLKNPFKLKFTGSTNDDYDGSEEKTVNIPTQYTHPTSSGGGSKASGLYKITTDANGHVTAAVAVTKEDITNLGIPAQDTNTTYSNFVKSGTGAAAGLVPSPGTTAGSTKYLREDGTWQVPPDNNTVYTHPTSAAGAKSSGLYKITTDATGHVTAAVAVAKTDITGLGIPAQDTVYTHPASSGGGSKASGFYKIATDANGHVSGVTAVTKTDITNLGIPAQDTNTVYTHPTSAAGAKASGLYKITTDATGHVTAAVAVTKTDITNLGIPAQDTNTTYVAATTSANGLMSSTDKAKLDKFGDGYVKAGLKSGTTLGAYATVEGNDNTSSSYGSHAEGYQTIATAQGSHAEGQGTTASGNFGSHAEGYKTTASGQWSHTEGTNTKASTDACHAEGDSTTASGVGAHAEGYLGVASGNASHVEGDNTKATAHHAHAEGGSTIANGENSHAEGGGSSTGTAAQWAHAEGHNSKANGESAHAEGDGSIASGKDSHAEGITTTAYGESSHAEGTKTTANGLASHAEGYNTTATNYASHASGKWNKGMVNGGGDSTKTGDVFVIGNGTGSSALSNAFRVAYDGSVLTTKAYSSSGADYAEFIKPWFDDNPDDEDRVGYFVTVKDDKIYKANENDYIAGITSGNPSVIGNGDEDYYWRWERDEFNRIVMIDVPEKIEKKDEDGNVVIDEETGMPIMVETGKIIKNGDFKPNPDYDPDLMNNYVPRKDRKEWDYVGMVGVLPVRDDGTCKVNSYCKCKDGGIATYTDEKSLETYMVIERVNDHVVKVILK